MKIPESARVLVSYSRTLPISVLFLTSRAAQLPSAGRATFAPMDRFRIICDANGVRPMRDLEAVHVQPGNSARHVSQITFSVDDGVEAPEV